MLGFMQMAGSSANLSRPVLDQLSALPAVAYSLRLLSSSYTGKAINVRRSSDNTAMDIGFVNGALDTATLLSFVGSGNGFVTTWYNQGSLGSSGNAAQSTASAQPQIVASGAVLTANSKPTIYFASAGIYLATPVNATLLNGTAFSVNAVSQNKDTSNNAQYVVSNRGNTSGVAGWIIRYQGASADTISFGFIATSGIPNTYLGALYNTLLIATMTYGPSVENTWVNGRNNQNGTVSYTPVTASNTLYIGSNPIVGGFVDTNVSEIMGWNIAIKSDRAIVEITQGNFYGINGAI